MGHGHAEGHGHSTAAGARRQRLVWVLAITLVVAAVQVVGGALSGSLALLADAAHMVSDSAGIGVALAATWLAARPATKARTFGMQRAEILAALANALLLGGIAVWVLVTAAGRWSDPPQVETGLMLAVAGVGVVANAGCLLLLREGQSESVNLRGAYLEVMGDLLGSVAVVVAGVVIATTGWTRADSVASIVIGLMILPRAWELLAQVVDVLLEATPSGVDLDHVRDHIRNVPGVLDVHDLHAWTITSGLPVLSAHVVVSDEALADGHGGRVLDALCACLGDHFDVEHCTFQLEAEAHAGHEAPVHD